jgi:regulator of sigma E protease
LIHEAGHYIAAKWSGVKPEEFGVGFPPRALGWTKREDGTWRRVKKGEITAKRTIWSINWLPLGGFVRLKGEQGEAAMDKDSFGQATRPRKFLIIAAGVVMNWLLAWGIFTSGYLIGVPMDGTALPASAIVRERYTEVTQVLDQGPAQAAGMRAGDRIVRIESTTVANSDEARLKIRELSTQQETVNVTVQRESQEVNLVTRPQALDGLNGARGLGIGLADTAIVRLPWWQAPLEGARTTALFTGRIVTGLAELLKNLIVHQRLAQEVSGPVGIAVMTGQVADQGVWALLQFAAVLSLNLAVVNFLPVPGLDGGRAFFLLIESVRRRRLNERTEAMIHGAGFIALIGLILLVTIQDVRNYGGTIWRGITALF